MKIFKGFSTATANKGFPPTNLTHDLLNKLSQLPTTINLFNGLCNLPPPSFFKEALIKQLSNPYSHQYTRSYGLPELAIEIAHLYSPFFQRTLDPMNEIVIMGGSSNSVFSSIQALINPGDTAIYFEPCDNKYKEIIEFHQGEAIGLALNPENWEINLAKLEETLLNKDVRLLIINSPHTPLGKVYSKKEINDLEHILMKYPDIFVLFDASYEKIVLEPEINVTGFTNPAFLERTATLFSADKAFFSTGLNLSWAIGHSKAINKIRYVHNVGTFCLYKPLQIALKESLKQAEEKYQDEKNYYTYINKILKRNREKLLEAMKKNTIFKNCQQNFLSTAGFSMMYNISQAQFLDLNGRDKMISMGFGVGNEILIGPGSFYFDKKNEKIGENYLKIDFCRSEEEIQRVCERVGKNENMF